jgi:hypothetical protein
VWGLVQDITNLGRILRIPAFGGEKGAQLDKELLAEIKRTERSLTPEEKAKLRSRLQQQLQGTDVDLGGLDTQQQLREVSMKAVRKVRELFGDRIIRRTPFSLRDDGQSINSELPECIRVRAYVELKETEHVQLSEFVNEMIDR